MNEAGRDKVPFLFGIDFEMDEGFFVLNPLHQTDVLFSIDGLTNSTSATKEVPEFQFSRSPEDFETYQKRFQRVMLGLQNGDSLVTNLTVKTPIETSLTLREIFDYSRSRYRIYVPNKFVCFSPECFVKIENGKIFTFPMKGTIDAEIENAEEIILSNHKETQEHTSVVDLLCSDLSRISSHVKVNRFRYIDELQTNNGRILQVSSEIEGTLPADYNKNIGTLILDLLPAGSIAGAPKDSTLQIIREAENEPRGFYTGVAGYFDGKNLDSCVLIRFIEQNGNDFYFRSGGGITVNSRCEDEYSEVIKKVYLPFQSS